MSQDGMSKPTEPMATYRTQKNISVKWLAERLGVTSRTIIRWERGTPRIPAYKLDDVASALDVKRHQLRPDLYDGMKEAAE
jgi:transcriptional regulator with XRE-family HTH domain